MLLHGGVGVELDDRLHGRVSINLFAEISSKELFVDLLILQFLQLDRLRGVFSGTPIGLLLLEVTIGVLYEFILGETVGVVLVLVNEVLEFSALVPAEVDLLLDAVEEVLSLLGEVHDGTGHTFGLQGLEVHRESRLRRHSTGLRLGLTLFLQGDTAAGYDADL